MAKKIGERKEWAGGYARWDGAVWVYYLNRRHAALGKGLDGRSKKKEVSTTMTSEENALEHLKAFEKDPVGYDPAKVAVGRPGLSFTDGLCVEFINYLATPTAQGGKGDSEGHCHDMRYNLRWWRTQFDECDLRKLTVEAIRSKVPVTDQLDERGRLVLKAPLGRQHKIIAIKHFIRWLRTVRGEGLLQAEGPKTEYLSVPQANHKLHDTEHALKRLNKGKRALDGYPRIRELLASRERWHWAMHALDLQADTGWHTTEVDRWIKLGGLWEQLPATRAGEAAGVLLTVHKSGKPHRTPVSNEGLFAARALYLWAKSREGERHTSYNPSTKQTHETMLKLFPRQQYDRLVVGLCNRHGIPKFGPGQMRHAVATLNVGHGYAESIVGSFLGHSDEQKGALVKSTYADPDSQLHVVKAHVDAIPQRILSPLQRLTQANAKATKKGGKKSAA